MVKDSGLSDTIAWREKCTILKECNTWVLQTLL